MNLKYLFKNILYFSFFCSFFISWAIYSAPLFVSMPSKAEIQLKKTERSKRSFRKKAICVGAIMIAASAIILANKNSDSVKSIRDRLRETDKKIDSIVKKVSTESVADGLKKIASRDDIKSDGSFFDAVKSYTAWQFTLVGAFLFDQAPIMLSSMLLTNIFNSSWSKVTNLIVPETLSWYTKSKTKLNDIFANLKAAVVPYDLYSDFLNQDTLSGKNNFQMRSLVKDLCDAAKNGKNFDDRGDIYHEYLFESIKAKYGTCGDKIEDLSDYAVAAGAKRNRVIHDGIETANIFQSTGDARQNIRDLIQLMRKDIQSLLAFAVLKVEDKLKPGEELDNDYGMKKINQLIGIVNKYFTHIDKLCSSSDSELIEYSKRNFGLFSVTYEFEKEFNLQLKGLQLYYFN